MHSAYLFLLWSSMGPVITQAFPQGPAQGSPTGGDGPAISPKPFCPSAPIHVDEASDLLSNIQKALASVGGDYVRQKRQQEPRQQTDPLTRPGLPPDNIQAKAFPHALAQRIVDQTCYVANRTCLVPPDNSSVKARHDVLNGLNLTMLFDLIVTTTSSALKQDSTDSIIAILGSNSTLVLSQTITTRRHDTELAETAASTRKQAVAAINATTMTPLSSDDVLKLPGYAAFASNAQPASSSPPTRRAQKTSSHSPITASDSYLARRDMLWDNFCYPKDGQDIAIVVEGLLRSLVFPLLFQAEPNDEGSQTLQYDIYHPGYAAEYDFYADGSLTYNVGISDHLTHATDFQRPDLSSQHASPGSAYGGKNPLTEAECFEAYLPSYDTPGASYSEGHNALAPKMSAFPAHGGLRGNIIKHGYLAKGNSVSTCPAGTTGPPQWNYTWHACDSTDIKVSDLIGEALISPSGDLGMLATSCVELSGKVNPQAVFEGAANQVFWGGVIRHDLNDDPNNRNWCGALEIAPFAP